MQNTKKLNTQIAKQERIWKIVFKMHPNHSNKFHTFGLSTIHNVLNQN